MTVDDEIREAARLRRFLDAIERPERRNDAVPLVPRRAAPVVLTHPGDAPHLVRGDPREV